MATAGGVLMVTAGGVLMATAGGVLTATAGGVLMVTAGGVLMATAGGVLMATAGGVLMATAGGVLMATDYHSVEICLQSWFVIHMSIMRSELILKAIYDRVAFICRREFKPSGCKLYNGISH